MRNPNYGGVHSTDSCHLGSILTRLLQEAVRFINLLASQDCRLDLLQDIPQRGFCK